MATNTAMIPLMNAGTGDLDEYAFACGAHLSVGYPDEVIAALERLSTQDAFSPSEIRHWELAKGWLWYTSYDSPSGITEILNHLCQLSGKLRSLRWCIDLAGCGENDFWVGGSNAHCAGVYVSTDTLDLPASQRHHFIYSTPTREQQLAKWSSLRLAVADDLHQRLPITVPRIAIASKLRYVMTTRDARDMTIRFAMAITALETLFIAPSERQYIWDPMVQDRIRDVNQASVSDLDGAFFKKVQTRRNDAMHRGGLDTAGTAPKQADVEVKIELVLRDSLCWAIRHQSVLKSAFAVDRWPSQSELIV